jgi:ATP-binding cassette, subfamily C, type I secretion system permease/ATPase
MVARQMKTVGEPYKTAFGKLRRSFVHAGLFSAGINLLMLAGPLYMLQIYDRVLSSGSVPTLMGLFVIIVVLYTFLGVYEFMRSRLLSRAAYRIDQLIGDIAFRQQLQDPAIVPPNSGNPLRDLEIIRGFLSGPAIRGLFDFPWIPIFLVAVFLIHPSLGFLTLAGAAVVAGVAWLNQWATRHTITIGMRLDAQERGFSERSQRSAEAIRALGMQSAIMGRWRNMHDSSLAQNQRGGDRSDGFSAFSRAFRLLLQSMLLSAGAYLALQQQISAGMIVGVSILAGRALAPVDQVIGQWRAIGRASEAHRRLKTALDQTPAEKPRVKLPSPTGAVSFNNVTKLMPGVAPGPDRPRILTQVSFELARGEVLGVIGNSAAGKSSLARMLVGIWRPDSGDVRLDGATLDQWAPDELGRYIGYLPQHVEMLPGTIAENISRFEPKADENQIFMAARVAGVHEMILGLPNGYATQIGAAEQPLSGGQVQRIGLARAVYRLPRIVVLDEPNAHLDAHGDDSLTETIRYLRKKGCTVVVMAHRPSVIAEASKVLILHKGMVARFGDREDIFQLAMQSVPAGASSAPLPSAAQKVG